MENNYGKLVLLSEGGPEQEYELGKSRVTIGRGTTNDIPLSDGHVSRGHARLECAPGVCTLVDLGSSNGSYVNGQRVERSILQPGDLVSLGGSQFRYELSPVAQEVGMTVIDREADLDKAIDLEVLPYAVNETSQSRLVVMTPQRTWEVPLEDINSLSIGRVDSNQLVLEHSKVSRQHAEVQRKGSLFLLPRPGLDQRDVARRCAHRPAHPAGRR